MMRRVLWRDVRPRTMAIWWRAQLSRSDRNRSSAALAASSTGGAVKEMRSSLPTGAAMAFRLARGWTFRARMTVPAWVDR
jgi:hypothetical protein